MDLFKKIFQSSIFFFVIATAIIIGLNLTPLIFQIRHSPEGRTFTMIHNNAQDFFFYQSIMNEGANGAWLTSDPYTYEPHQSSIIFSYFLWLGKLSKLLGLSYAITYHIVRIILGISLLSVVCYLLFFLRIPYPRLTYFFFLFASPFMHTINDYGKTVSVPFMHWWTAMDPIRRAAYLPHHMAGGLGLVISMILIIRYFNKPQPKYLIWLIITSALLAFIHTPSLLIILVIFPPALIIFFILNHVSYNESKFSFFNFHFSLNFQSLKIENLKFIENWKLEIGNCIGLLGYWVIGLSAMLFMILQTKNGFPWSQYIDWEKNLQFPLDRELFGAFGILFPFAVIGIIKALKSKKFESILIASWFIVPITVIPFATKLNISNIRLIQGLPYLPFAILAVLGIKTLINLINLKINKFIGLLGYWVIGLLFIFFTYPTFQWSLKDQIREYWPIFGNVYLDNRLNNAFAYINNNFPPKTVTLSTFYTGNYLPAFTHTVSYIGHFGYTYNNEQKDKNVRKFFENKMNMEEAKEFLLSNKIALIWQGPEEKPIYKDYLYPKILKTVYDKEEVTIYNLK